MELETTKENLLIEIHDSENERIEKVTVEQESSFNRPNLKNDLDFLINIDLVEFDKADQAYYLTYEGYEEVERIGSRREYDKIDIKLKNGKYKNIKSIFLGILIIGFTIAALIGIKPSSKIKFDSSIIESMEVEFKLKMDSIIKIRCIAQINKHWNWTSVKADSIIDINRFGNIIFNDKNGKIYRIKPEELSMKEIAANTTEFEILKLQDYFIQDWEMNELVNLARDEVGELTEVEKYCLKIPIVLDANYSRENLTKMSINKLISKSGDLAYQLKNSANNQQMKLELNN